MLETLPSETALYAETFGEINQIDWLKNYTLAIIMILDFRRDLIIKRTILSMVKNIEVVVIIFGLGYLNEFIIKRPYILN